MACRFSGTALICNQAPCDGSGVLLARDIQETKIVPNSSMDLTDEIIARVKSAQKWDWNAQLSDFQIRVTQNAIYLANLKTGIVLLLPDNGNEPVEWTKNTYE
jgi:hypothetical protein